MIFDAVRSRSCFVWTSTKCLLCHLSKKKCRVHICILNYYFVASALKHRGKCVNFLFVGHIDMSYFGATGTPVLDFWWRLLWVSKPEWVLPYLHHGGECHVHSPRSTSGATTCQPLDGRHAASPVPTYYCRGEVAGIQTRALRISVSKTFYKLS